MADLDLAQRVSDDSISYEAGARLIHEYAGHDQLREVIAAHAALGEIKDGLTYFERSPTKDPECFARWKRLNDALAAARKVVG